MPKTCSTCKYETFGDWDAPCVDCYVNKAGDGGAHWEPRDEEKKGRNLMATIQQIEDVLRVSGLSWTMNYFPGSDAYSFYISTDTDANS